MNCLKLNISLFTWYICWAPIAFSQEYTIERWFEGRSFAIVLTFDDWSPGHGLVAMPELVRRHLTGTFFVTTANTFAGGGYQKIQWGANNGMEIGNHTNLHKNLDELSNEELEEEIYGAKKRLESSLSNVKVETFCYPRGRFNESIIQEVKKDHIGARIFNHSSDYDFRYDFAKSRNDYYKVRQIRINNQSIVSSEVEEMIDLANNNNGLLVFTFHSIGEKDTWFDQVSEESFKAFLDLVGENRDRAWVTTFSKAIKYHKERNSAKIETIRQSNTEWVLNITDDLDDSVYREELTFRITKITNKNVLHVYQNDIEIKFEVDESGIVFNVIPDAGLIKIVFDFNKTLG